MNFAIANKQSEVSNQYLKKIGTDRSSQLRKTFFDDLKLKQQESQQYFKDKISSIHVQNNGNAQPAQPSFECGCAFLLQWFESLVLLKIKVIESHIKQITNFRHCLQRGRTLLQ